MQEPNGYMRHKAQRKVMGIPGCSRRHVREVEASGEEVLDPELETPELEFTTVRPPESPERLKPRKRTTTGKKPVTPPAI